jgi:membrane-associated phospholipid phosphatase
MAEADAMVIQQATPRGRTTVGGAHRVQAKALERTAAAEPPARPRPVRLGPQIVVIAAAIAVYFLVRGATDSAAAEAVRNAHKLVSFERALGIYHEPGLQHALASSETVRTVFNWIYIWGHWPVIVVTLLWLARRNPDVFRRMRNAMMLSGGVGMVLFATFPVAPPRLADLGMADTVTLTSHAYRVLQPAVFTNQFAAMPSLHAGWNLLIGLAIIAAARRPLVRLVGALLPMLMVSSVVLTANHYIVDVLAGTALTSVCWILVPRLRGMLRGPLHGARSWISDSWRGLRAEWGPGSREISATAVSKPAGFVRRARRDWVPARMAWTRDDEEMDDHALHAAAQGRPAG